MAIDDAARQSCAAIAGRLQRAGFDGRYEAPEKYHMTLAFLGNVAPAQCEAVERTLETLAKVPALQVVLNRVGGFPHERRPRVVYVGARSQGRDFALLATATCDRYAMLGFKLEKDPVAHVTIARVKAPQRPLPPIEVEPFAVEITALSLFESLPDRERNTSRYEIRRTIALASPR